LALIAHELKASYAFVERNFFLTRRYWGWELAFLVYSVAGALSISLIGAAAQDDRLLLTLMVGAVFWNYLSVVFSWIAETIAVERWEGTLEYTFMAPVRRWTQLLGSCLYAMAYGLVHTAAMLLVLVLFFPQLNPAGMNVATAVIFVLLGSFSFVGIGMMAAILPLLYVERGAQMTSSHACSSSPACTTPRRCCQAGCSSCRISRPRRTSSTACGPGSSTGRR
jgi:ABC-2 type transport system permease protein